LINQYLKKENSKKLKKQLVLVSTENILTDPKLYMNHASWNINFISNYALICDLNTDMEVQHRFAAATANPARLQQIINILIFT